MNQPFSNVCDTIRLVAYLAGDMSDDEAGRVERHLDQCDECAGKLQLAAALPGQWSAAGEMLSDDDFDGQLPDVGDLDPFAEDVRDSEPSFPTATEGTMLLREIRGWLDPTDDPRMLGRLAGYEVLGVIGHGGMGIVLKGFEASLNRYVAIKTMAPRLASSQAARQRFAREAQAAAAIAHENVIAIHRVDQTHGLPFLVMPYCGGISLQQRLDRDGPLQLDEALRIASQIAAGLAAAHARGLIHRDIKPANILLGSGVDRVRITDFGLARAADDARMTRTGMIAGTPQYMSPEQARGRKLDARTDLFSLGSVLYTMLAGKPPFCGESNYEIVDAVADAKPAELSTLRSDVPSWMDALLAILHHKDAKFRAASANDVQHLIDVCLQHLSDATQPLPDQLQRPVSRKWLWPVGGALAMMAVSILAFVFLRDQTTGNSGTALNSPVEQLSTGNESTPVEESIETDVVPLETFVGELELIESELTDLEKQPW